MNRSQAVRPPLRVGIIGTGRIAADHAQGYVKAGAEIVALADPSETTLTRRAAEWSVTQVFADDRDLLALPHVEAVSVSTPNAVHGAVTMAAAAHGKHVLCEKPISLSLVEGRAMIDACARAGVVLQVNHHLRANPSVRRVVELLYVGALGHVTFIRWTTAAICLTLRGTSAGRSWKPTRGRPPAGRCRSRSTARAGRWSTATGVAGGPRRGRRGLGPHPGGRGVRGGGARRRAGHLHR